MKLTLRNNGIYYINYLVNGKQYRHSLKTNDKRIAKELLKQYQIGSIPTKEQTQKIKTNTVQNLVWKYLKFCENHYTPKTLSGIRFHLKQLSATNPKLDITDLDFTVLNSLVNNQNTKYQSRLSRSYLSMFFNWCIDNGYYTNDNPIVKIKKVKIPQKLPVYITIDELELILDGTNYLDMKIRTLIHDVILFAFYSGFRLNEITSLKWDQIDFENNIISLDNQTSKTKSGKIRVVPISHKIQPMLLNRFKGKRSEFVFEHNYSNRNINFLVSKNFKSIIKNIPKINQTTHFHTLRHSFASCLIQKNINVVTVSKLLGHANISTTMIYTHINNNVLRDAIAVL